MIQRLTFLFLLCVFGPANAQLSDRYAFSVDRPDVTESPFTVQPLCFQFENGFDLLKDGNALEFQVPNIMFRTGIYASGELRLAVQHGIRRSRNNSDSLDQTDFYLLGYKQALFGQKAGRPTMALLGNYAFINQIDPGSSAYEYDLIAAFQNDFNANNMLGYNIGFEKKGLNKEFNALFSVSYSHQFHKLYSGFFEYYNVIGKKYKEHGFDGGLTYLCGKKCSIDVLFGFNLNKILFFSTGFSFRLDFHKPRKKTRIS